MKKYRKSCMLLTGAFFLLLIIAGVAMFSAGFYYGTKYDRSSRGYVDTILPLILAPNGDAELRKRETPEAAKEPVPGALSTLGAFIEIREIKGASTVAYDTHTGRVIGANYAAVVDCKNGDAVVDIGLTLHGDEWQISRFHVMLPKAK